MTSEIPSEYLPVYADRFRTCSEVRVARDNLVELCHGYGQFLVMRTMLEQMAQGGRSNADFAVWAQSLVRQEREARQGIKLSRRLLTVGMV